MELCDGKTFARADGDKMATSVAGRQLRVRHVPQKRPLPQGSFDVRQRDPAHQRRTMSAPALTTGGKLFCFFDGEQMVFKLGKDADRSRADLEGANFASANFP